MKAAARYAIVAPQHKSWDKQSVIKRCPNFFPTATLAISFALNGAFRRVTGGPRLKHNNVRCMMRSTGTDKPTEKRMIAAGTFRQSTTRVI